MDFEVAAQRLARDQKKHRQGRKPVEMSAKAKREADLRKQQQTALAAQRDGERKHAEYLETYLRQREQELHINYLNSLTATSIYGEGDKIALPPSVLEQLTSTAADNVEDATGRLTRHAASSASSSPWTFRVAVRNPEYSFPASPVLRALTAPDEGHDDFYDNNSDLEVDDDDDSSTTTNAAYLDELRHKYLAYTHATVVEFTQEEGHVGLPEPIASVLINLAATRQQQAQGVGLMKTFRTVDPARTTVDATMDDEQSMEIADDGHDEKTPGHLAWGAFDLPDLPIEISLIRLPKGKGATLTPTTNAIQNGFYNLDDIKLVLEQSLIRTRATLTVGDVIHSWHRGIKYDLLVSALRPASFGAVLCLNTDLEVEFGGHEQATSAKGDLSNDIAGSVPTGGRMLSDTSPSTPPAMPLATADNLHLAPEPPVDAADVCLVQIRADAAHVRRRFDVNTATVKDLFVFARTITDEDQFQLVTRYPRRVFRLSQDGGRTLMEADVTAKQELFMVERL